MDKKYWNKFYKKNMVINKPSNFAQFCLEKYIPPKSTILELGSGNLRDAYFFANNSHKVIAVDQNSVITNNSNNISLLTENFTEIDLQLHKGFNVAYSRFSMHSIEEKDEDSILLKVFNALPKNGIFLIEARTIKDSLFGKGVYKGDNAYFTDHYRRFIDPSEFIRKVQSIGYKILFSVVSDGLSIYEDQDPILMRIVLGK